MNLISSLTKKNLQVLSLGQQRVVHFCTRGEEEEEGYPPKKSKLVNSQSTKITSSTQAFAVTYHFWLKLLSSDVFKRQVGRRDNGLCEATRACLSDPVAQLKRVVSQKRCRSRQPKVIPGNHLGTFKFMGREK